MYKGIVFDLDDTLYYEYDYVVQGLKKASDFLENAYPAYRGVLLDEMIEILEKEGRGKIFNRICAKYSLNVNIDYLVDLYRSVEPDISLYKDAQEILVYAGMNGIRTGIITDGAAGVQHRKIKALSLENRVDFIIVTDDYGRDFWKPNVRPYRLMEDKLKIPSRDMVYVGDNPHKDFVGAKMAGYHTVRILRSRGLYVLDCESEENEAEQIITNLTEIIL